MSNSRYPTLAATLEKRIAQGIYRDRLPTVRELAAEFKVSKQTVTLALRPLIVKGILKAEGRRGIHVAAPVKSPGIIGIVATGDMSILENDKKLKELQEQINRDGFESVLIGITNWISSRSVCKLLSDHFSGIIFTNSTLSFEIAEHLDRLLIPFVSCNRLPVYPHINYVETNWRGAIRQLAEDLADMGYRKLGLFFKGGWKATTGSSEKNGARSRRNSACPCWNATESVWITAVPPLRICADFWKFCRKNRNIRNS